jgi:hypothetical protein
MASGGPPPGGNMVRLWDSQTGVRLREWHFGAPPETAFFAGSGPNCVARCPSALRAAGFRVETSPFCKAKHDKPALGRA